MKANIQNALEIYQTYIYIYGSVIYKYIVYVYVLNWYAMCMVPCLTLTLIWCQTTWK